MNLKRYKPLSHFVTTMTLRHELEFDVYVCCGTGCMGVFFLHSILFLLFMFYMFASHHHSSVVRRPLPFIAIQSFVLIEFITTQILNKERGFARTKLAKVATNVDSSRRDLMTVSQATHKHYIQIGLLSFE